MVAEDPRSAWALLMSFALHVGVAIAVALLGAPVAQGESWKPATDVWSGKTFEIAGLVPAALEAPGTNAPSQPSPPADDKAAVTGNGAAEPAAAPARAVEAAAPVEAPKPIEPDYPTDSWLGVAGELEQADADGEQKPESEREPERDLLVERLLAASHKNELDDEPAPALEAPRDEAGRAPVGGMDESARPRDLARAFTRAIPAANTRDPVWSRLPLGDAGKAWVLIRVGDDGRIEDVEPRRPLEAYLERLIRRTVLALRAGTFALASANDGELALELSVVVAQRARATGPLALGFDPPRPERPGRAYFQLESGRFVEVFVSIESP